jgi:hypothetical protein
MTGEIYAVDLLFSNLPILLQLPALHRVTYEDHRVMTGQDLDGGGHRVLEDTVPTFKESG